MIITGKKKTRIYKQLMNHTDLNTDNTRGDGTTMGICPTIQSNYRCLSSGACNVCENISGTHEGCDVTSTRPVCDADSATGGIQGSADGKVAQCTECKMDGRQLYI